MTIKRVRAHHLAQMKAAGTPITMLTSYDAITTRIFDEAGTDMLLVGDSYANVMLGFDSTTQVGIEEMVLATGAVARVAKRAFVVADLPFGSYETSPADAVANAVKLIRAGASAVKLEGGVRMAPTIEAIVRAGINVVAHIGYTPQSENALGEYVYKAVAMALIRCARTRLLLPKLALSPSFSNSFRHLSLPKLPKILQFLLLVSVPVNTLMARF